MSTSDVPPVAQAPHALAETPPAMDEIRIYSHSPLFYWWPVWLFGFIFALITLMDGSRLAIIPSDALATKEKIGNNNEVLTNLYGVPTDDRLSKLTETATEEERQKVRVANSDFRSVEAKLPVGSEVVKVRPHISPRTWMGPMYLIILLLVIVITNVPLRGLWSLVALIGIVVIVLLISLFKVWDTILNAFIGLHVFINLAGYLLLGVVLCAAWAVATFIFDRRSYIIFTPGQIRVCEEIGSRERTYDTTGMTIEKRRDDWFRHIFLGFGSGDLVVRTAGADRHEILMPNVALIGFKIDPIQQLMRQRQIEAAPGHVPPTV
jgi:hypothetical protein